MLPAARVTFSTSSLHSRNQLGRQNTTRPFRARIVFAEIHVSSPSDDMPKHEKRRKNQMDVRQRCAQTWQEQTRGTRASPKMG